MITLGIKIGEPVSESDQRILDWLRERVRAGLPVSDTYLVDDQGNEVAPPK